MAINYYNYPNVLKTSEIEATFNPSQTIPFLHNTGKLTPNVSVWEKQIIGSDIFWEAIGVGKVSASQSKLKIETIDSNSLNLTNQYGGIVTYKVKVITE